MSAQWRHFEPLWVWLFEFMVYTQSEKRQGGGVARGRGTTRVMGRIGVVGAPEANKVKI